MVTGSEEAHGMQDDELDELQWVSALADGQVQAHFFFLALASAACAAARRATGTR